MTDQAARLTVVADKQDRGVAQWLRSLDSQLKKADDRAEKLRKTLSGLGSGLGPIPGLGGGGSTGGGAPRSAPRVPTNTTAALAKQEREALALAQAYAKADAQAGNYDSAVRRLSMALQNQSTLNTRQVFTVQQQIAGFDRAAAGATKASTGMSTLSSAARGLQGVLGTLGIAATVASLVQLGKESVDAGLKLEQSKNSLRALAGSQRLYEEALAAARQQQSLFGGSLQENIDGIQGLITVSRTSGIELAKLIDLSQRLAVKDPSQGAAGARIALQEAFSGDPTSLAKRYEIPKAALAALRDESTTTGEKLQLLDGYLTSIGITSEVAAGSVPKATIAINNLGAAAEGVQTRFGNFAANAAAPFLATITALLGGTADMQGAIEAFTTAQSDLFGLTGKTRDAFTAVTSAILLTSAQFPELISQTETYMNVQAGLLAVTEQVPAPLAALGAVIASLLGFLPPASTETEYLGKAQEGTAAQTAAMGKELEHSGDAIAAELEEKLKSEAQTQRLADAQALLASLGGQVASGLLTSGQAAAQYAAMLQIPIDKARELINLQAALSLNATAGVGKPTKGGLNAASRSQVALNRAVGSVVNPYASPEKPKRGGGGGGGRVSEAEKEQEQLLKAADDYNDKREDLERDHQEKLADLAEEGARKRKEAEDKYNLSRLEGASSFYDKITAMENQDLARDLSARYEKAVLEAQQIAKDKGADVANEYLAAQREAIANQGEREAAIAEAEKEGNAPEAERLRGLLELQKRADEERLNQILASQDSQLAQQQEAWSKEEQAYAEHLDKLAETYAEKTGQLPGMASTLGPPPPAGTTGAAAVQNAGGGGGAAGASTAAQGATLVVDPLVQGAVDQGFGRVEGKLGDVLGRLDAIEKRTGDVERAVRSIPRSSIATS